VLRDSFGRRINDLRISVTDRCNFKCFYCKSVEGPVHLRKEHLLTYEEIERLARVLVRLGVRKIRLTGGEPLVRAKLEHLVLRLSQIPNLEDLALTTNGFNLFEKAEVLKKSGLKRVTISLDSLNRERFSQITKSRDLDNVLRSIEAAKRWGLEPVKINCVVVRGINHDEIPRFAELARTSDLGVRFIEFMPLDEDEQWTADKLVTGAEIFDALNQLYELVPLGATDSSETSQNYSFRDGKGSIGLVQPVSRPFCGECSRIRLTADGKIRTCLFSMKEHDIKELLREGVDDGTVMDRLREITLVKEQGHHINEPDFNSPPRTMSRIGG
jgi:cyclic pyranopterin phosphate synthase